MFRGQSCSVHRWQGTCPFMHQVAGCSLVMTSRLQGPPAKRLMAALWATPSPFPPPPLGPPCTSHDQEDQPATMQPMPQSKMVFALGLSSKTCDFFGLAGSHNLAETAAAAREGGATRTAEGCSPGAAGPSEERLC